jgi:hypothetical protein
MASDWKTKKDKKDHDFVLEFRYCPTQCLKPECKVCGYWWAGKHKKAGQPAVLGPKPYDE